MESRVVVVLDQVLPDLVEHLQAALAVDGHRLRRGCREPTEAVRQPDTKRASNPRRVTGRHLIQASRSVRCRPGPSWRRDQGEQPSGCDVTYGALAHPMEHGGYRDRPEPDDPSTLPGPADASAAEPDDALIRRICAGETACFEVLMRRHNERIYRTVRAVLGDDADVEDVMQQAYVSAYQHLDRFEGRARFSTWMTRIAINEAYARLRKRHRTEPAPWEDDHAMADEPEAAGPTPEQIAARQEMQPCSSAPSTRSACPTARSSCCARWKACRRPRPPSA